MIKTPKTNYVSAQEMRIIYPDTFEAPCKEELDNIKEGDAVKVSTGSERFWAEVTKVNGENIQAIIDNDLVLQSHGLQYNDLIEFQKHHVHSIIVKK